MRTKPFGKQLKILMIEDDSAHVDLVKDWLSDLGRDFDLQSFPEGKTALEHLDALVDAPSQEKASNLPDLLLLDLKLPDMTGHQILDHLKETDYFDRLPVIIFTVSKEQEDILKSYKKGCACFLNKSAGRKAFQELLNQLALSGRISR